MGNYKEFIKYLIPVVVFYCLGDYITTLVALHCGCTELNPFMEGVVTDPIAFAVVKLCIIPLLWMFYKQNITWRYRWAPFVFMAVIGGIVTMSNSCFILMSLGVL